MDLNASLANQAARAAAAGPNAHGSQLVAVDIRYFNPDSDVEMLDEGSGRDILQGMAEAGDQYNIGLMGARRPDHDQSGSNAFTGVPHTNQSGASILTGALSINQSLDAATMAPATHQAPTLAPLHRNYMLSANRPDDHRRALPADMWTPEPDTRSLHMQHQVFPDSRNDQINADAGGDNMFSQLDCDGRSETAEGDAPILSIDGVIVQPGRVEWEDLAASIQHAIIHIMTQKTSFMTAWLQKLLLVPGDGLIEFFKRFRKDYEKYARYEARAQIVETMDMREFAAGIGMENPYNMVYLERETYVTDYITKKQLDDGFTFLLAKHQEPWIKELSDWCRQGREPNEFYPIYFDDPVVDNLIDKTNPDSELDPVSQRTEDYKEIARGAWRRYDVFNAPPPQDVVAERERRLTAWVSSVSHRFEAELTELERRAERDAMEASNQNASVSQQPATTGARDKAMEEITARGRKRVPTFKMQDYFESELFTDDEDVGNEQDAADDKTFRVRRSGTRQRRKTVAEKEETKRQQQAMFAARRAVKEAEKKAEKEAEKKAEKEKKAAEKQAKKEQKEAEKEAAKKAAKEAAGEKVRKPRGPRGPYNRKKKTATEEEEADKPAEEKQETEKPARKKQNPDKPARSRKKASKPANKDQEADKETQPEKFEKIIDNRSDKIRRGLARLSLPSLEYYNQLTPKNDGTDSFSAEQKEMLAASNIYDVVFFYDRIMARKRAEDFLRLRTGKRFVTLYEQLEKMIGKELMKELSTMPAFGAMFRAKKVVPNKLDALPALDDSSKLLDPTPRSERAEKKLPDGLDEPQQEVYFKLGTQDAHAEPRDRRNELVLEPPKVRGNFEFAVDRTLEHVRECSKDLLWDWHYRLGYSIAAGDLESLRVALKARERELAKLRAAKSQTGQSQSFGQIQSFAQLRAAKSQTGQSQSFGGTSTFGAPSASSSGQIEAPVEHESLIKF